MTILDGTRLLAETHMAQVASQYRDETLDSSGSLVILCVPIIAIALAFAIYRWYDRTPTPVDTPEALIYDLCRIHELPKSSRALLLKIGRANEMVQPATMFLSSEHFETAVAAGAKRLKYVADDQKQLAIVRRRVFAE